MSEAGLIDHPGDRPVETAPAWLRLHWFVPLALLMLAADIAVALTTAWPSTRIERAIAIDLGLLVPLLHAWCYRRRGRRAVLRSIALACLGIWLASWLVPSAHHDLLADLRWLRYAGLAILTVIELRVIVGVYRAIWRRGSIDDSARDVAERTGMPPALARLVALEASLWRRLADWLTRRRG